MTRIAEPSSAVAAPRSELGVGSVLGGRYRLVQPLESGGMANVWVAHDVALAVDVAIKLVRIRRRSDADLERELELRLIHEARVIAQIRHPAIVAVIDVGRADSGEPYVVMELLAGDDLADRLARDGPLAPDEAVRLLLPVVQGLSIAHAKGIVHRDLKPANIVLARRDDGAVQPKLLDFGIAKSEKLDSPRVTQNGMTMGSPGYMSPEQVKGLEADARSDVWSLCATLYELLTGKLPFERHTDVATMFAICHDAVQLPADIDPELAAIIARGLDKEPARRWSDMRELGGRLARWLTSVGVEHDIAGTALSFWTDLQVAEPKPALEGSATSSVSTDRPVSIAGLSPRLPASVWLFVAVIAATSVAAGGSWWVKLARRDSAAAATPTPTRVEAITLRDAPGDITRRLESSPAAAEAGAPAPAPAPQPIVEGPARSEAAKIPETRETRETPEPQQPRVVDAGPVLADAAPSASDAASGEWPVESETPDPGASEPEPELY